MPAMTNVELGLRLGKGPLAAKWLLEALEQDGLVERTHDGLWQLTDEAERRYGRLLREISSRRDEEQAMAR